MGGAPGQDQPDLMDTSETVHISSVALIKMLRHGRAGVPLEVMGLMLGEFVDDYTVRVVDVFAMPQSGTGVSVEAVDPVFQTRMMDMLKQVGRAETVVGWYHSHPGFGPWLSSVDVSTQGAFEALNKRAVAVVVDPIQSVRGKVVIDAFRTIPARTAMMMKEPRETTSNLGHLQKPSLVALIHGLNRHYYSIAIAYDLLPDEQAALTAVSNELALVGSATARIGDAEKDRLAMMMDVAAMSESYAKAVCSVNQKTVADQKEGDDKKPPVTGKKDPRRHLKQSSEELINVSCLNMFKQAVSSV